MMKKPFMPLRSCHSHSAVLYKVGEHNKHENPNHFGGETTFVRMLKKALGKSKKNLKTVVEDKNLTVLLIY